MSQVMVDNILNEMVVNMAREDRTVAMIEEFDRESCFKLARRINKIVQADDKVNKPMKDREPIKIVISSYGGCVLSYFGIASLIERLIERGYTIHTHLESMAMSAGFYLLMLGNKRTANRYGIGLIHTVQTGIYYSPIQGVKEEMESREMLQEMIEKLTLKHTKFTQEELNEIRKCKVDKQMTAEELLEKGVIDEII
ncbi:MAG: ATP-dependent Clp protease proteolytic subunit [Sarcina sp.]